MTDLLLRALAYVIIAVVAFVSGMLYERAHGDHQQVVAESKFHVAQRGLKVQSAARVSTVATKAAKEKRAGETSIRHEVETENEVDKWFYTRVPAHAVDSVWGVRERAPAANAGH